MLLLLNLSNYFRKTKMTAFASITLPNGATPVVNQTFSQESNLQGIAKWVNRASGVAIGYPMIQQTLRVPNKDTPNYRLDLKVILPTLEVTTPSSGSGYVSAPALAFNNIVNVNVALNSRSTLDQRKDLLAYFRAYVLKPEFENAFLNYETVY